VRATADPAAWPAWEPTADPVAVRHLSAALAADGVEVEAGRLLGPMTTLKVGGPAAGYVEVAAEVHLQLVLDRLAAYDEAAVPLLVLGRGSNLLVADDGFPGLVLRLGAGFRGLTRAGPEVTAGAAVAMPALAAWVAEQGLAGLELAAGVPATVGGSVRMNAGAHGGEVATLLLRARVVRAGERPTELDPSGLGLAYRRSALPPRSVVTAATWRLHDDDPAAVRARLDELRAWRRATQPIGERTCGSVFTNPAGDSAGRLVEAAGLKGLRRGGARVSSKHANFIEVDRGAPAADAHALIAEVRTRVHEAAGVWLLPEVCAVGRFALTDQGTR